MLRRSLPPLAALALAALLVLALAGPGGAAPAPVAHAAKARAKSCGTLAAPQQSAGYRFKVTKGSVTCKTARRVLKRFIRTGKRTKGWDCRNGARDTAWSEACGSPYHSLNDTFRDRNFKKVIKAYFVLDE